MSDIVIKSPRSSWKTALRWSARVFITLIALVLVVVVAFILINLKDEKLSNEAQALLRESEVKVEDAQNGFYILKQIAAPADSELLQTGIASVRAERAAFEQGGRAYMNYNLALKPGKALDFKWEHKQCQKTRDNCVKDDLQYRKELTAQIEQNQSLLQRYALMRGMSDYQERIVPTVATSLPAYAHLLAAMDMLTTQAVFDIADGNLEAGLAALEDNDKQIRLMLLKSDLLISKMAMQAALRKQARTISELALLYPALPGQYAQRLHALVRPLNAAEKNMADSYRSEARMQMTMIQTLQSDLRAEIEAGTKADTQAENEVAGHVIWPLNRLQKYAYQQNATLNLLASYWQVVIEASADAPQHLETAKKKLTERAQKTLGSGFFSFPHYFYNPVGKILTSLSMPYPLSYVERTIDTDAYLRLVSLQIDILAKKLPEAGIASYLQNSPPELRNPYDAKPMEWNASASQLQFTGHEKASNNPDGGKLSVVALR